MHVFGRELATEEVCMLVTSERRKDCVELEKVIDATSWSLEEFLGD